MPKDQYFSFIVLAVLNKYLIDLIIARQILASAFGWQLHRNDKLQSKSSGFEKLKMQIRQDNLFV